MNAMVLVRLPVGTVAGREPSPSVSALRATINYRKEGEQ